MRLIIQPEHESASLYVAQYVIDRINSFGPTRERPFVLGLPTGSSPALIYKAIIDQYKAGKVSFKNVVTFNMDEYVALPKDHPQSYYSFMMANLFSSVDILPTNINILNGNAPNLGLECAAYEAKIKELGGIDLFLAGAGADGHIAFNEPGSSLTSRTRVKTLASDTLRANARFFEGRVAEVPRVALTVGVQTIMEARAVVAIVTGPHKAQALHEAVEGGVSHMCTLSCLQNHPCAMIVADEDATLELKVKTVKYFKSVEESAG